VKETTSDELFAARLGLPEEQREGMAVQFQEPKALLGRKSAR
jgi:hypothetical protein